LQQTGVELALEILEAVKDNPFLHSAFECKGSKLAEELGALCQVESIYDLGVRVYQPQEQNQEPHIPCLNFGVENLVEPNFVS
jgi:hypothetical protein